MNKKLSKIVLSTMLGASAVTGTALVATSCAKTEVAEVLVAKKAVDATNTSNVISKEFSGGVNFSLTTNDGKATAVDITGSDIEISKESYLLAPSTAGGKLLLKPNTAATSETKKTLSFNLKYKLAVADAVEKKVAVKIDVEKWVVVSVAEITANDPTNTDKKINKTFTKGLTIQLKSINGVLIPITVVMPATKAYLEAYALVEGKLTIKPKISVANSETTALVLTLTYKDEKGANQTIDTSGITVEAWTIV